MSLTENELIERVIGWVQQNASIKRQAGITITPNTDLIAAGLIDSLAFVDLITFIESHNGCRVDLVDTDPSEFAVIRGLCRLALKDLSAIQSQSAR